METTKETFWVWIRQMVNENQVPVKIGNVEFWDDNGSLSYSIPVAQWDSKAIATDIAEYIFEHRELLRA